MSESQVFEQLFEAASKTRHNAHAPYSDCLIGSAVLGDDGEIYPGCNVENSSYGGTVCAERVAIWNAVSNGAKEIGAIIVVSDSPNPWPPCGMCRQVMTEFCNDDTPVRLANLDGKFIDYRLKDLVPHAMTAAYLPEA